MHRTEIRPEGSSAIERHMRRTPNTPKTAIIKKFISEADPKIDLRSTDFSEEMDSTILVRERVRVSKVDGLFKRKNGVITAETGHTISILSDKKTIVYSKRDVAVEKTKQKKRPKQNETPKEGNWPKERSSPQKKKRQQVIESSNSEEVGIPGCSWWNHESEEESESPISQGYRK